MPDASGNRSPIDRYYAATSLYNTSVPNVGTDVPDMCGTGPYKYEYGSWDQVNKVWRLDYDPTYWRGWANAGQGGGSNYIKTIIEKGIATWPTRKMLFLTGEFDTAVVPTVNMFDLLQGSNKYLPLAGLTLVTNITTLTNEAMFFCMNVSGDSAYQSYVGYPYHLLVDPYFFSDQNIRLAFAWAFNYTEYIQQAYFGEAIQQASWWVDGLVPASSENLTLTASMRNLDLNVMKYYLAQAIIGGQNISQVGFETTLFYNSGNEQRRIALQMITAAFTSLGPQYKCNVVGLDWPVFLDNMKGMDMPVFCLGWQADFADPDDFAKPYMHSNGTFPVMQGPPYPSDQAIIDAEIEAAAIEQNLAARDLMYQDLQARYWQDCMSIPLVQPVGRRFARDWVKGWYYNDLLPGLYFYDLYKAIPVGSVTNIDLDVTYTIVPLITYRKVFISMGKMKVPFANGLLAQMTFNVTVRRNDAAGLVPTIISLVRNNLTALTDYRNRQNSSATGYDMTGVSWPNGGWVYIEGGTGSLGTQYRLLGAQSPVYLSQVIILTNGGTYTTVTLTWYENGVTSTLPANATWSIGAIGRIPCAAGALYNDTNTSNNQVTLNPNIYNCTAMTQTVQVPGGPTTYMKYYLIPGDVDGDGQQYILDAITLSNQYLKDWTQPGFNPDADTNSDGVVNILDWILFANHFLEKMWFLSDP
jgi:ABC-type transport system substrate-binding protein